MVEARLPVDQRVASVEGDQVVIGPVDESRFLAAYDPKRHGGERMATTGDLGPERWYPPSQRRERLNQIIQVG